MPFCLHEIQTTAFLLLSDFIISLLLRPVKHNPISLCIEIEQNERIDVPSMAKRHVRAPRAPAHGKPAGNSLLRAGISGFLLGVLLLFLIAFIAAFAALKSNNPQSLVFPAALLATAVGGYGGALLGAKTAEKQETNPFLGSFAVGGALLLFLLLLSLFVPAPGTNSLLHRLSPLLLLPVASALGGLTIAAHRPNQKRRLKKLTAGKRRS